MLKITKVKGKKGITLIALIVTIIVLLILARSKYSNANRRQWIIKQGTRGKYTKRNSRSKR